MNFIPVSRPYLDKSDVDYINTHSLQKSIIANGIPNQLFSDKIRGFLNYKYAMPVSNGSAALIAALSALKLKKNSNILIPNTTIISVLNAVYINNLNPIFIDVSIKNWNITLEEFKNCLLKNKIHAIILVGIYNSCSNQNEIKKICKKNNIKIIEDASESFGGTFNKKKLGSYGDITTLSFYANKVVTTGEGGMVLTNDKKVFEHISKYINLFFNKERNFKHEEIGFNFRMNAISCALGLSQFKKISKFIKYRKFLYELYIEKLNWEFYTTQEIGKNVNSSYWVFPIMLNNNRNLHKLIKYLHKNQIQTRRLFFPLSEQPLNKKKQTLCNSREIYERGLYLPMGNGIRENEVKRVIKIINSF